MENNNAEIVRGYKVFDPDWTCSPNGNKKQYTCPGKFEENISPVRCDRGMHFCKKAADCFNYYNFNPENKVAEVIAYGDIAEEGDKCCTNKLEIVREISWPELLEIVNTGKGCSGLCNSGNRNSGNRNSGNRNSGNRNSGNRNSGNCNSGNCNSGNCNSGDWNSGDWNSGNRNSGDWNSGDWNSGNRNSGNCNSGDWNSGDWNSGDWNSGNRNSGNCNSGDWNSGDWNSTDYSSGCFNTEEQPIIFFDKPSDYTYKDWLVSEARFLLNQIPKDVVEWIWSSNMTDEEKTEHPEHETTGGYLKILDKKDCAQLWWNGLSERDRNCVKALPNFDAEKFEQCTGIKLDTEADV